MARCLGGMCAGVFLVAVAGCAGDSFLVSFSRASPQHLVVPGDVVGVSLRLKEALSGAGISVQEKSVGDDMRIAGLTKGGKVFCIHLRQDTQEGAIRVKVTLQWDKEADENFWQTIVRPLAPPDTKIATK
jgi:hypothetical protein